MKLWRSLGSEPQRSEDGIGSGPFRFASNPFLYPGQTLGCLMDVVEVDVGDGFEQLFDTVVARVSRRADWRVIPAPWHEGDATRSVIVSHPIAFPRDIPAALAPRNLADLRYSTANG